MTMHFHTAGRRRAVLLLVLFLAGCSSGPKSVAVGGRLLRDGQPFKISQEQLPPGDPGIRVVFYSLGGAAGVQEVYPAPVNLADASFQVQPPKGKGIPPGKYRISVIEGAFGSGDKLNGEFGQENSPLTVDIPEKGSVNLEVDVGTKKVTVK